MAVRVGSIDLTALRNVQTEDTRNVVQLRGPGQEGSVTHDLGREPVTVVLEGELFGEHSLDNLETLRQAQQKAEPMAFAAEAVAGSDLTEVVIADLRVQEVAGFPERFAFFMRVREHTEPPTSDQANAQAADAAAQADADARTQDKIAAQQALANPQTLPAAVEARPTLLNEVTGAQLGGAMTKGLTGNFLSGTGISKVMSALGKVNPAILGDVMNVLQGNGSITDLVMKLAESGISILSALTGVDLGIAVDILHAVAGGAEFLTKAQEVSTHGQNVIALMGDFDPGAVFEPDSSTANSSTLSDITEECTAFIKSLDALLKTQSVDAVVKLVKDLGIGSTLGSALTLVRTALDKVAAFITQKLATLVQVAPVIPAVLQAVLETGEQVASFMLPDDSGSGDLSPVIDTVTKILGVCEQVVASLPTAAEMTALGTSVSTVSTTLKAMQDSLGSVTGVSTSVSTSTSTSVRTSTSTGGTI